MIPPEQLCIPCVQRYLQHAGPLGPAPPRPLLVLNNVVLLAAHQEVVGVRRQNFHHLLSKPTVEVPIGLYYPQKVLAGLAGHGAQTESSEELKAGQRHNS